MTYPTWQPGTLYQPGDIVVPITQPAPSATAVANGDFSGGATGWTFTGGASYVNDGHSWGGSGAVRLPGNVATGEALNDTELVIPVGKQITASCMIEQGAAISGATRGWVEVHWFDASDLLLRIDKGNEVADGSSGAWKKSEVTATAPAGAAYCRAGIALWSVADHNHPIWGDALQVSGTFAGLPSSLAYKAVQSASGFSAASEPAWPSILGVTVVDNEVTWEAISASRVVWEAEPLYVSGNTEPDWPTAEGAQVLDGSVTFRAVSRRVEDENCPNTKIVAIAASKVFCADNDIVRYSATVNPLDWSTADDAGYLPTGLQNYGSNPIEAMGLYRGNLIVFNAEGFQLWQVDEDPASMALIDALPMGSTHHHALAPVSNDLFYLASQGVRTVGIAASSTNIQAGDVGMPIDPLVQAAVEVAVANEVLPMGLYNPNAGQYWLMFPQYPAAALSIYGDLGPFLSLSAPVDGFTYTAGGGVRPYVYSLIGDTEMPPGLTLHADGTVTGTPTEAGEFTWQVQVQDSRGSVAAKTDTATVQDGPALLGNAPDGFLGEVYAGFAYTMVAGAAPIDRVEIINGELPAWLEFDEETATLTATGPTTEEFVAYMTYRIWDTAGLYYDHVDVFDFVRKVWNPADKSAHALLLQNTKVLTTTNPAGSTYAGARSVASASSGKVYFEFKILKVPVGTGAANLGVGFGDATFGLGVEFPGQSDTSWGWQSNGRLVRGATFIGHGYTWGEGDLLRFELNLDTNVCRIGIKGRMALTVADFPVSEDYSGSAPIFPFGNVPDVAGSEQPEIELHIYAAQMEDEIPAGATAIGDAM